MEVNEAQEMKQKTSWQRVHIFSKSLLFYGGGNVKST